MKRAIQRAREARGLSRRQCAEAVGVDVHTWKRWELGLMAPRPRHLLAAAEVLDVLPQVLDDFSTKRKEAGPAKNPASTVAA